MKKIFIDCCKEENENQTFSLKCQSNSNFNVMILSNNTKDKLLETIRNINENQSKRLSFVSHEVRTPLNCIISILETLKKFLTYYL